MARPATPSKRNRANENFRKAILGFLKRGHRISRRYRAHVYVQVSRQHKHYEYTSTTDTSFPLSGEALDQFYPLPTRKTAADFEDEDQSSTDTSPENAEEDASATSLA